MKKIALIISVMIFCLSCNESTESQNETEETVEAPVGTDNFTLQEGDTLFFENTNFRVVGKENEITEGDFMGYKFRMYDLKTGKEFAYKAEENEIVWFSSVFNKYLLLDEGTDAQFRSIIILDMTTGQAVFKQNYVNHEGAGLQGDTFLYWLQIEKLPDGVTAKCPEEQSGYVEKWQFSLKTLKPAKTNEYDCIYFQ